MGKNNNDIIELWGHEFRRAKYGLDEEQVVFFVNNLISQRDTFIERQEHLASLTKLAERTVAEADKLAEEIEKEAIDQAKAEATAIVAGAEQEAKQIIEEKKAEIMATANKEAEAIKANAQQQAELMREEKAKEIQTELRGMAQSVYRQFLSQLESLQQQVIALEVEFEPTLSHLVKQVNPTTVEQENNVTPGTDSGVSPEFAEGILAEVTEQVQTMDQLDNSELEKKMPAPSETTYYKGEVELEILPPVDISKIMRIMTYLDNLPEVGTTELIPLATPIIVASLREPMHLLEILTTLPEVDNVTEAVDGEITSFTGTPQPKRRKIQITLSKASILAEAKERLNSEVSNT